MNCIQDESGSALSLVISLIVIITSFLLIFYGVQHVSYQQLAREQNYYQASLNARSLLKWGQTQEHLTTLTDTLFSPFHSIPGRVIRYRIGFGEIWMADGYAPSDTVRRIAWVGRQTDRFANTALVTAGDAFENPVYLTGNTQISGRIVTGRFGLRPRTFRRLTYSGPRADALKIERMPQSQMPELRSLEVIRSQHFERFRPHRGDTTLYLNGRSLDIRDWQQITRIAGPGSIRSPSVPEQIIEAWALNWLIESEIELTQSRRWQHCAFVAERGAIVDGTFRGVQLISPERIRIQPHSRLLDHSLILIEGRSEHLKRRFPVIEIGDDCIVNGMIIYHRRSGMPEAFYQPMRIGKSVSFKGMIYSDYSVPATLTIEGTLFMTTSDFVYDGVQIRNWLNGVNLRADSTFISLNVFQKADRPTLLEQYELF